MIHKITNNTIKIENLAKESVKSGDIITVSVIKQLAAGKWAISIKGKVFPAISELALNPGDKIKAQVLRTGHGLVLKIVEDNQKPLQQLLSKFGVTNDKISEMIVMSLIRSDLKITPENISKLRKALDRINRNDPKTARLLAIILGKGIDITGAGIDELLGLLSYGDSSDESEKRKNRDRRGESKEETKKQIIAAVRKSSEEQNSMLQVFNHLNGKDQNWIIIPYSYQFDTSTYTGTIRVLYNASIQKLTKLVLIVTTPDNDIFSFSLQSLDNLVLIRIYHSEPGNINDFEKFLHEFNIKLQNKGAKIDDIIYNEVDFDGFEPLSDGVQLKAIDTMT